MRGEIIGVWSETWREIWSKLAKHRDAPDDLFCELYRESVSSFAEQPDINTLADIVDNPLQARQAFRRLKPAAFKGEIALVGFLERAQSVLMDLGGDPLANRYFVLCESFIAKYSLRYELRRPLTLHPTLPGIFARLMHELTETTATDPHLNQLMHEFQETVRDLRGDRSPGRIKTCIQKQINLLEAIAQRSPNVTSPTLGAMCRQLDHWPHNGVREALSNLYGFASNYPGIRHAGSANGRLREIEMLDLVTISIVLAGFTPYLSSSLSPSRIYQAGES